MPKDHRRVLIEADEEQFRRLIAERIAKDYLAKYAAEKRK